MGPRATATGSSQAAYFARPVGRERSVVEKMTGMTPVAFTCETQAGFNMESTAAEGGLTCASSMPIWASSMHQHV